MWARKASGMPCTCRLIYSIKEVATNKDMGLLLNTTYYWNFVNLNGRQGIFEGYAWSTDVLVDYCYYQLGALINVMVILLVIEVRSLRWVQDVSC